MRIVEAILRDQSTVLSVSSLICDYYGIDDVYLSVPTVVGRGGVERTLRLGLSAEEASGPAPLGGAPALDDRHAGARPGVAVGGHGPGDGAAGGRGPPGASGLVGTRSRRRRPARRPPPRAR